MIKEKGKRIAIFAFTGGSEGIANYVAYYLRALRKVVDDIVFVAGKDLEESETEKLSGIVSKIICHNQDVNRFSAYRIGYLWVLEHRLLQEADELVLADDSCYGPVFPFERAFEEMDKKPCDFWGMTDSYEAVYHLQSFFLVFKKDVFTSRAFHNYVSGFARQKEARLNEEGFTAALEEARFMPAVYINVDEETRGALTYRDGGGDLTVHPVILLGRGMPLVRIEAINGTLGLNQKESPWELLRRIGEVNPELHSVMLEHLGEKGMNKEDRWLTPKEIIGDAKVVSFDIFDTLLSRPYMKPADLFLHMEEELGAGGFRDSRVRAERRARRHHRGQADVTLEQIYEELGGKFRRLKDEELRYEREHLFPKRDAKNIYDEAVRQGKMIIAVSDMYLPQAFLEEVLKEKGYTEISRVFVSNEENCCKGDGRLFQKVLEELNIGRGDIVHIGDNRVADKEAPEALGIRACHRVSDVERMFLNPAMAKYKLFVEGNPCLASSVLAGLYARRHANDVLSSPFTELGYYLGGPLAVGYCQYIHKVAKERGNDTILFVSRDGYALHQVYQKMYPDGIPSYYIYASRKLILRNSIDYKNESYFRNVCEIYSKECLQDAVVTRDNLDRYQAGMEQWAAANAECYRKYVDSMHITGQKIMSVDMTTRSYTSLYMLHQVFGDRIDCGMFSISYGDPCDYETFSYAERTWRNEDIPLLMMQEELITAPERSALSIDGEGNIVFSSPNPIEDYRLEKYKEILKGLEEFADDFIRLTAGNGPCITFDLWFKLFRSYVGNSNFGDRQLLKSVYHDDIGAKTYDNLYNACIQERPSQEIDVGRLYRKNMKHLKGIRKLAVALCVETAVIVLLSVLLLMS